MAKSGPRTVRRYTDHFKRTAVRLNRLDGVAVSDVVESFYIYPYMLSRWRKEASEGVLVMKGKEVNVDKDTSSELKELRKIKRDYERLKVELFF
ncbi:transposase [Granulosicoccus sp.]|nr:transposase [Granulosicoccus sp.]MDB4222357.1 transposase [Granulosicoccus sp.]